MHTEAAKKVYKESRVECITHRERNLAFDHRERFIRRLSLLTIKNNGNTFALCFPHHIYNRPPPVAVHKAHLRPITNALANGSLPTARYQRQFTENPRNACEPTHVSPGM